MKKLLLILIALPMIGFGQDDKIIFSSGDTIYGKVIEVGVNDITYQHKNETTNNISKKKDIAKVIYSSGRIEEFQGLSILKSKIAKERNKRKAERKLIQKNYKKSFEIGFIAGLSNNFNKHPLRNMLPVDNNSRTYHLLGGLNLKYNLSSKISFSSSIIHKTNENIHNDVGFGSFYSKQTYIHTPLIFEYLAVNSNIKLNLKSGLYYAYLIDENNSIPINTISNPNNSGLGWFSGDFYKKSDYGIVLGTGISYSFNKLSLLLDLHYNQGITDISSENWANFWEGGRQYNMSLLTMIGINYKFVK